MWPCFVLAPISQLRAIPTLGRMESNFYLTDSSLKKGGHAVSKGMFLEGVAALLGHLLLINFL